MPGDWDDGDVLIYDKGLKAYRANWKKVGSIASDKRVYDIARCNSTFIVGTEEPSKPPAGKFALVADMELEKISDLYCGYVNAYSVNHVIVRDTQRGLGIGIQLYRFIAKSGISLISDDTQYFGARALWSRLSQQIDMVVDVIDTDKRSVIAKGVRLHQGNIDSDFDKTYWSYNIHDGMRNIRFVLREIS